MNDIDDVNLREALKKTRRTCLAIRNVFVVFAAIFALGWLTAMGTAIVSSGAGNMTQSIPMAVYILAYGGIVLMAFATLIRMFSDVTQGLAPFSGKQANRLRLIAGLVLVLVVLELVYTASMSYSIIPEMGYSIGINDAYPADSINLNVGMLAFSAIMYSLSALFRYAALLQQLSDDTV